MATVISANRAPIKKYETTVNAEFAKMHTALTKLVKDVATVEYYGANADRIKREAGTMAAEFTTAMTNAWTDFADGISQAVTGISRSLGGEAIPFKVTTKAVAPASLPASDNQSADISALEGLRTNVTARFNEVQQAVTTCTSGLAKIPKTKAGWSGSARDQAEGVAATLKTRATRLVNESESAITKYLSAQIDDLRGR